MQFRQLGQSDLKITPLGVGAWAMGGGGWAFAWGPQDDTQSIAAIRAALEAGWNWIDTAAIYGLGHSETVVARALEGISRTGPTSSPSAHGVGRVRPDPEAAQAGLGDRRMRSQPAPAEARRHRPLPNALARARRGRRGGLGGDAASPADRQGALGRRVELQRWRNCAASRRSGPSPRSSRRTRSSRRRSRTTSCPSARQTGSASSCTAR